MQYLEDRDNIDFFKDIIRDYDDFILCTETDLDGIITFVSNGFCKISGYKKEELLGYSHSVMRNPKTKSEVFKKIWEKIKLEETIEVEITSVNANGNLFVNEVKISPIYKNNKHSFYYYFLAKNVTILTPEAYQPGSLPGGSWGNLILGMASHLDAFSGYPRRT